MVVVARAIGTGEPLAFPGGCNSRSLPLTVTTLRRAVPRPVPVARFDVFGAPIARHGAHNAACRCSMTTYRRPCRRRCASSCGSVLSDVSQQAASRSYMHGTPAAVSRSRGTWRPHLRRVDRDDGDLHRPRGHAIPRPLMTVGWKPLACKTLMAAVVSSSSNGWASPAVTPSLWACSCWSERFLAVTLISL